MLGIQFPNLSGSKIVKADPESESTMGLYRKLLDKTYVRKLSISIIYGSKVDDFHTLNKDYIFTLNVCATQELYKLIQQQNIIIQDLQNRINILENNI